MTATHAESIIEGYLKRLDGELSALPAGRRIEVSGQIAEHIAEARSQLADETDADVLTILDRLGDPEEIAAEARARFDVTGGTPGLVEVGALTLLAAGSAVFPLVPWLIGTVLVWRSRAWSARTKYAGAYVPLVAGLALLVLGGLAQALLWGHLLFLPFMLALLATFLIPVGSAVYLGYRLRGRLPVLAWLAVLLVCLAVYVPTVSIFVPSKATAFTSLGDPAVNTCGGFYGTLQFSPNTPMVARVPVSVGICSDGTQVRQTWGPDCFPEAGVGEVVSVQSCTVESSPDGSLTITVQASERPLTSFIGGRSESRSWRITPDGHIDGF